MHEETGWSEDGLLLGPLGSDLIAALVKHPSGTGRTLCQGNVFTQCSWSISSGQMDVVFLIAGLSEGTFTIEFLQLREKLRQNPT